MILLFSICYSYSNSALSGRFPSLPSPPSLARFASSPPFCPSGKVDGVSGDKTKLHDDEVPVTFML
jgi:hypothetical protein